MSLDLDIKLNKTLRLHDLLSACREEIMKLTETSRIPSLQTDLFEGGSKLALNDEYVLKNMF